MVARLNDYEIKLVKFHGEFVWHAYDETDELFLVISDDLTIHCATGMWRSMVCCSERRLLSYDMGAGLALEPRNRPGWDRPAKPSVQLAFKIEPMGHIHSARDRAATAMVFSMAAT